MNIRTIWLTCAQNTAEGPEYDQIVYLEHIQAAKPGYSVRVKRGSAGRQMPTDSAITPNVLRFDDAEKLWRDFVRVALREGYRLVNGGGDYTPRMFTNGYPLPELDRPSNAFLQQPPVPEPPKPRPLVTIPAAPISTAKPQPAKPTGRAAYKPKPKPARRLPLSAARRIALED